MDEDGLDDYFVGGSINHVGSIFLQTQNGFVKQDPSFLEDDKSIEDTGALLVDADGDGDNDLYVVSGGYEFASDSDKPKDRLYLNDGKSQFKETDEDVFPKLNLSGAQAYNADFDKDGDQDILVLGRQVPSNYPAPASSYILKNNSSKANVKFDIFTEIQPSEFENLGMATSAVITNFNNDNRLDIIIVGEWMAIRVFKNTETGFEEVSEKMGLTGDTTGWWWSINQGDFDNDGDMDYVLGNNGLNYKYKATENETFDIFVSDFDKNNEKDIVISYYNEGKQYPLRRRECSSQQIPGIKQKFQNYKSLRKQLCKMYIPKNLWNQPCTIR